MADHSVNQSNIPDVATHSVFNLASGLESLDVELEIWNDQNHLVWRNNEQQCLRKAFAHGAGLNSVSPLDNSSSCNWDRAPCNDTVFLSESRRDTSPASLERHSLQELPDSRWVKTFENVTPDGYLTVVRVNVTGLVRAGQILEERIKELNLLSSIDFLTGIANRRSLEMALHAELQRANRNESELGLLMIDIDHFKKYNDRYGHLAGDECLRRIARILRQCTRRAGDMVARYGGEEFVLLLPAADLCRAQEVAGKCMFEMQMENMAHAASPTASVVTLSIGVACLKGHAGTSSTALINAADAAMYRAKAGGRARYEIATHKDWEMAEGTPRTALAP